PPAKEITSGLPRNARMAAIPSPTSPRVRAAKRPSRRCISRVAAMSRTIGATTRRSERREETSMIEQRATHYRWDDLPLEELKPDLGRRLITTERMMLAHVYLEKGCIVPKHSHENEQLAYIVEGCLRFWLGDDESEVVDVAAGEVLLLPSYLPHKAE